VRRVHNTSPQTHERRKDHAEYAKCSQQPRKPQRSHHRARGVSNESRKRLDAKSLEELAASLKTQGILAPLLVRELEESKCEAVTGARRLRAAAKLAELEKLPVSMVKLTDAEAIEAECLELSVVGKYFLCLYAAGDVVYM
jgi:ParB/RepB/Spo0J family partition protein